ncbi:hypothetical protein CGJ08_01580 [Vibrio parahaemolyticus]|nr:hypothetical protein [Vibrio parahaemolyticus]EGR3062907.1 hypothetical protein [Vibrio parahaemolyticus]EGR3072938.1 hypothetical protein [Vibrio parahaemolyticus]EGR3171317.1 hypothetical protein [Vibrio parahaemolyticus]TOG14259.1 hypothetical protein CGJ08_01580 [Vibrio parahaemolyticus]
MIIWSTLNIFDIMCFYVGIKKMTEEKKMTAAKRAAELGAGGERKLGEIAKIFGCTPSNLDAKFKSNPKQFDIIVLGCIAYRDRNQEADL